MTPDPFKSKSLAETYKEPAKVVRRPRRPVDQVSDRQAEIIGWVLVYRRINSTWPSYREIMDAFDLASTNSVHLHLSKITRAGFLRYKGARNFVADFAQIRKTNLVNRIPWLRGVNLDDLLYLPPPIHLSPEVISRFPQLASALSNG